MYDCTEALTDTRALWHSRRTVLPLSSASNEDTLLEATRLRSSPDNHMLKLLVHKAGHLTFQLLPQQQRGLIHATELLAVLSPPTDRCSTPTTGPGFLGSSQHPSPATAPAWLALLACIVRREG